MGVRVHSGPEDPVNLLRSGIVNRMNLWIVVSFSLLGAALALAPARAQQDVLPDIPKGNIAVRLDPL